MPTYVSDADPYYRWKRLEALTQMLQGGMQARRQRREQQFARDIAMLQSLAEQVEKGEAPPDWAPIDRTLQSIGKYDSATAQSLRDMLSLKYGPASQAAKTQAEVLSAADDADHWARLREMAAQQLMPAAQQLPGMASSPIFQGMIDRFAQAQEAPGWLEQIDRALGHLPPSERFNLMQQRSKQLEAAGIVRPLTPLDLDPRGRTDVFMSGLPEGGQAREWYRRRIGDVPSAGEKMAHQRGLAGLKYRGEELRQDVTEEEGRMERHRTKEARLREKGAGGGAEKPVNLRTVVMQEARRRASEWDRRAKEIPDEDEYGTRNEKLSQQRRQEALGPRPAEVSNTTAQEINRSVNGMRGLSAQQKEYAALRILERYLENRAAGAEHADALRRAIAGDDEE